jgi:hypothetical protein
LHEELRSLAEIVVTNVDQESSKRDVLTLQFNVESLHFVEKQFQPAAAALSMRSEAGM